MAPASRPVGGIALLITTIAVLAPVLYRFASPYLPAILPPYIESLSPSSIAKTFSSSSSQVAEHWSSSSSSSSFTCLPHTYTTEIVSLDPLLIYIDSFLSPSEIAALLAAGEPAFAPSRVFKAGRRQDTADRTSSSAALPRDDPAVSCVLARAETFLGTLLDAARDDIGPPQLVRYTAGQRFNRHRDWYERPQPARKGMRGRGRTWNRVASFFAILQDGCTGGETWFPLVNATTTTTTTTTAPGTDGKNGAEGAGRRFWRAHEEGGLAFRPVAGNALFWVNLFANGTGDERTVHAGLPLEDGLKTAMNIWPRKFYA